MMNPVYVQQVYLIYQYLQNKAVQQSLIQHAGGEGAIAGLIKNNPIFQMGLQPPAAAASPTPPVPGLSNYLSLGPGGPPRSPDYRHPNSGYGDPYDQGIGYWNGVPMYHNQRERGMHQKNHNMIGNPWGTNPNDYWSRFACSQKMTKTASRKTETVVLRPILGSAFHKVWMQ